MPSPPIRFGFQTGQQNVTWPDLLALWHECEQLGFDSGWNFDHFVPIFADPAGPCLEAWTLLGALAMQTSTLRIGTMVTGNTYRHPAVLAKMATTVDILSGGRLNLGLGAGWFEFEHQAYDIAFPRLSNRLQMLDEALDVMKRLWTEHRANFAGKYYQLRDAYFEPKSVQRPHPPIMIGAAGEQVALRIVAQHADAWNTFGSPAVMRHKIGVLREHCRRLGRDPDSIEKSVLIPMMLTEDRTRAEQAVRATATLWSLPPEEARGRMLVGDAGAVTGQIEAFVNAGVTHIILMLTPPYDLDGLRAFAGRVIPHFRARS
jgi:F420-dependent oxidoreductase-like protein